MALDQTQLGELVSAACAELRGLEAQRPPGDVSDAPSSRELFLEILAVALGNMYDKTPIPGQLYDRAILKPIAKGLDDTEVARITLRSEDWIRLEGVVRAAEGQKAYILNRASLAVLSTSTPEGLLGEVLTRIVRCYSEGSVTPQLRRRAREIGAYFLTRISRS